MNYHVIRQTDADYLARKERAKDLLPEAKRERLIQTFRFKQPVMQSRIGKWLVESGDFEVG